LEKWLKDIKLEFETMNTFEKKLNKLEDELEIHREHKAVNDNYILNFLFYPKTRTAEFKVLNLVQDVPPSRLTAIKETISEVHDLGNRLLAESRHWILDFNKIYYLFPPKVKKDKRGNKKVIQYRELLHIYESIFTGKPLEYDLVMKEFLEIIQLHYYGRYEQYEMSKPKDPDDQSKQLLLAVLRANLFMAYAKKLGIMNLGGICVDVSNWLIDEGVKEYIKEIGFDECRSGLFLLGYLLGEVANAQYSDNKKSKPVLGKLNYQGMDLKRIQILSLEIFEKLQQYKKLDPKVENIHAQFKKIMDKHSRKWPLNHIENVFYILSGYAFNTHQIIRKAAEKKEK
jgi:CRISPR-associated protein Csh1